MWEEKCNPDKVYVGKHFFRKTYHKKKDGYMKFIGTQFDSRMIRDMGISVTELEEDSLQIADGVTLHRNFDQTTPYEKLNPDFFYQEEPDFIRGSEATRLRNRATERFSRL